MSTRRDCSGDPMGLGTKRIEQSGLLTRIAATENVSLCAG
jgi:hypothetical protein